MTVKTITIQFPTRGNADMIDITEQVGAAINETGLKDGIVTIFCPSATSALTTIEYESGCLADFRRLFNEILSPDREYMHNLRWRDGNGHSHARAALLKASFTVPFVDGRLILGTWQQIVYVDFDVRERRRELVLQFIGE
jgi:secondary thiamine-phosphate synthase enzyme